MKMFRGSQKMSDTRCLVKICNILMVPSLNGLSFFPQQYGGNLKNASVISFWKLWHLNGSNVMALCWQSLFEDLTIAQILWA